MSSAERVPSAVNFLTGDRVNHYPDGSAIEVLIIDYFNECHSDDENNYRNEGKTIKIEKTRSHSKTCIKLIVGQQELIACCGFMGEDQH